MHPTKSGISPIDLGELIFDAIIFDCDGTLVNTAPAHFNAFNSALYEQGAVMDKDWYSERLAMSRKELLTNLQNRTGSRLDIDLAVMRSEQHYLVLASAVEAIEETVELVNRFYGKLPLAVASSGQRESVEASLRSTGLLSKFDHIVTAGEVTNHKPHPEAFIRAAELLCKQPEKCLVVEDTDQGLLAAKRAGCMYIDIRDFAGIYRGQ